MPQGDQIRHPCNPPYRKKHAKLTLHATIPACWKRNIFQNPSRVVRTERQRVFVPCCTASSKCWRSRVWMRIRSPSVVPAMFRKPRWVRVLEHDRQLERANCCSSSGGVIGASLGCTNGAAVSNLKGFPPHLGGPALSFALWRPLIKMESP